MASTATLYATDSGGVGAGTWTNLTNGQGAPDGTYATWTNASSGAIGTYEALAFGAGAAIGTPSRIDSVSVTVTFRVGDTANFTSANVQLRDGITTLGAAQPLTLSSTPGNSQTVTVTGAAQWNNLSNLRVRVVATRAATTTSDTFSVDAVGVVVNYTTGPIVYRTSSATTVVSNPTTAGSLTLSISPASGDLALLRVSCTNYPASFAVSDTGGHTWTLLGQNGSGRVYGAIVSAGTHTVSLSYSSGFTASLLACVDLFYGGSITVRATGTGSGASASKSIAATGAAAGDLVYAVVGIYVNGTTYTPATGFSALSVINASQPALSQRAQYKLPTADETISTLGSSISNTWDAIGFALEAAPNQPPTANAGPDQSVAAGATVTLAGTDSDPEGSIATRAWSQVSGPAVTLSGSGTTRTFTAPVAGTPSALVFQYTVTDAGGLSASNDVTVNVAALPAPVAAFTATPTGGTSPLTVAFTDTSSGGPTSWAWDFGDGNTATAQHPTHTYTAAGTYTATLTASNAGGNSTATTTITVASATVERLRLGAGTVTLRLGDQPVSKVYVGDTLVWP